MKIWKDYQHQHQQKFLDELIALLRIPSISTSSEHKKDMQHCAAMIQQRLLQAGADKAEIHSTKGHPIVYAEKITNPNWPTILVYGHYDVQPPDPLELWHSGPFEPIIKDGKIYARGSADDKGQVYMHIKALEIFTQTQTLCTNIKFLIEGEEEVGSPNLATFIATNKKLLQCDVIIISDSATLSLNNPTIDVGVRGLSYIQIEVTGPNRDLHSGVYGGAVANPITILSKMIASIHDENNHITIPGFYDEVLVITDAERAQLAKAPFNEDEYKKDLEINEVWGEKGFSTSERTGIRPTFEVNGIWGGYTGEGAKTVLPSKAYAKLSCRLVPNQKSDTITTLLINHFKKIAPPSVQVKIENLHGGDAYMTPINSIEYKAASKAIEQTLGKTPFPVRGGGSIPITALFEKELEVKVIFLGFGLDSDNIHSPNEKFNIINFYKGIETIPYFHKIYAELKKNEQKYTNLAT